MPVVVEVATRASPAASRIVVAGFRRLRPVAREGWAGAGGGVVTAWRPEVVPGRLPRLRRFAPLPDRRVRRLRRRIPDGYGGSYCMDESGYPVLIRIDFAQKEPTPH